TQLPHYARSMLASERSVSQPPRRVGKVDDRAVAQILPEARTLDLNHHPVGGRLRMLLQKTANILVSLHTSDALSRQELFPLVGRERRKKSSDFTGEVNLVLCAGGLAREPGICKQVGAVRRHAERL